MNFFNKIKNFAKEVSELDKSINVSKKDYLEIYERNKELEKEIAERTQELNQANKTILTLQLIVLRLLSLECAICRKRYCSDCFSLMIRLRPCRTPVSIQNSLCFRRNSRAILGPMYGRSSAGVRKRPLMSAGWRTCLNTREMFCPPGNTRRKAGQVFE